MLPDKKLNPIAQAKALKKLIDSGLTTKETAKRIGKSPSYVSNTLRLLTLPEALKDGLISGLIFSGHARALAAIGDKRKMVKAYKQILQTEGSVRDAEALARKIKKEKPKEEPFGKIKKEISQALGGAEVELSRSRVQTRISLTMKGTYEKTDPWLKKVYQRLTRPNLFKGQ